ncbi:MAG: hypothetical protein NXI26_09610 [bacterium]|nr:hypothetical protein [Phaeodactylibacter xiamenensis]MCR9052104.1 hypothetical protein [bacterium]
MGLSQAGVAVHGVYEVWKLCIELQRPYLKRSACPPLAAFAWLLQRRG